MEQIKGKYYKSAKKLVVNIDGKSYSKIVTVEESETTLTKVETLNKLIRGKKTKKEALLKFQADIIKLMTPKEKEKAKAKDKVIAKAKGEKKALKKEVKKSKSSKTTTKKKAVADKIAKTIEKGDTAVDSEGKIVSNVADIVNSVKEIKQEEPKPQTSPYKRLGEY